VVTSRLTQRIVLQAQAPAPSVAALAQTVIATRGLPVRIGDVAAVRDGAAPASAMRSSADAPGSWYFHAVRR
jgi:multidrug efflux pump subunit AcrB